MRVISVEIDEDLGTGYIRLGYGDVFDTKPHDNIMLDYDENKRLIGIELIGSIDSAKDIPQKILKKHGADETVFDAIIALSDEMSV